MEEGLLQAADLDVMAIQPSQESFDGGVSFAGDADEITVFGQCVGVFFQGLLQPRIPSARAPHAQRGDG